MNSPVGSRIKQVHISGKPLQLEQIYRVAHTDAETNPDVGYLVLDKDQSTEHEVPTILREALAEYLQTKSPFPEPARGRWKQL